MSKRTVRRSPLEPAVRAILDQRVGAGEHGDDALLERVKNRVVAAVRQDQQAQHRTVRPSEQGWRTIAPGVECKMLWATATAQSCMLRLAPAATIGVHLHPADEECVVLEGSLRVGAGLVLQAGDFHVARKGSSHGPVSTDTGALIYLRGALEETLSG